MTQAPEPHMSAKTAAALVVFIGVVDVATTRLLPSPIDPFFRAAVVVGLLFWVRRRVGLSWAELGCTRDKAGSGLRWGLLAMLVVGTAIVVGVALPATRSYFESNVVRADSAAAHILEPLLVIPFATVLFEEVIFRGVLLGILLRVTARLRAVILGSIVFGLWHIPPALSDADGKSAIAATGVVLGTIAFTTAAGIVFSWLRLRSGSLLAPILAHVASNSFAYLGALVALR